MEKLYASVFIAKIRRHRGAQRSVARWSLPLLLERLNIYTDPQEPMIITPGIYEVGKPDENSPVAITTNFALTYFIVSGEIEGSKIPAWLLIQDTEGLSVMTAWAAGKFPGTRWRTSSRNAASMIRSRRAPSSSRAMPPGSAATWKRNCLTGRSSSVPGKRPIFGLAEVPESNLGKHSLTYPGRNARRRSPFMPQLRRGSPDEQILRIGENLNVVTKVYGQAMKERNPKPPGSGP